MFCPPQYYSALEGNPRHYLMARAIQFWTPGIPMVYYVGLLAGRNDHKVNKLLSATDLRMRRRWARSYVCLQLPSVTT